MSQPAQPGTTGSSTLVRLLDRTDSVLSRIEALMLAATCVLVVIIMVMVSADAISRYIFNKPLQFTYDLVTMYFLPGGMFFALSFTLRRGGHINVDLFSSALPRAVSRLALGVSFLASAIFVTIIVYRVAVQAEESWRLGEATVGLYAWPTWVGEAIVPIAFTVLLLRILYMGFANITAAFIHDEALELAITPSREVQQEEAL